MRNLAVTRRYQSTISDGESDDTCCFTLGENGQLLICDGKNQKFLRFKDVTFLQREDKAEGGVLKVQDICQMQYVSTMDFLFLASEDGTFFQTRDPILDIENYTELFKCEQGVVKFSVSPDCRRMAILTKQRTLLLLTLPDLECLVVHQLEQSEQKITQEIDEGQNYQGSIAWRNDSRYFAVNVPVFSSGGSNSPQGREIHVYDEDGALYSKSQFEEFEILNQVLAWQPSGGLIATFGRSPHGNSIIFSELNGLKRSHLKLPTTKDHNEDVINVSWNAGSDILFIQYKTKVELWTRNNYVWMLKKTLIHAGKNSPPQPVKYCNWDPDLPGRFHVVYDNYYTVYDLISLYNSGFSNGSAMTVSWNGNNLYATPFRDNSAPPPFGFLQSTVDSNVVQVLVSDFWDGFLCITQDGLVLFRRQDDTGLAVTDRLSFPDDFDLNEVDGWAWPNFNTLACTCNGILLISNLNLQQEAIDKCQQDEIPPKITFAKENQMDELSEHYILRLFPLVEPNQNKETDELLAETRDGCLLRLNLETKSASTVLSTAHESSSRFAFSSCTIHHLLLPNKLLVILFHDPGSRQLFISSERQSTSSSTPPPLRIGGDVTSVAIFCDNILYSTLSGSLEILNKSLILELLECQQQQHQTDVSKLLETKKFSRKLEKGSIIVSCCVNRLLEPSLILQIIPRGNLETICPRPLLVSTIRATLRDENSNNSNEGVLGVGRYEKIMNAVRRHRLDYRVLIDEMRAIEHDHPDSTLAKSLKAMVEEVKDSHSLVLLVTDLDEEYEDCIRIIKDLLEPHLLHNDNEDDDQVKEATTTTRKQNIEEAYLASLAKLGLLEEALLSRLIQGETKEQRNVVTSRVKFLSYYCNNQDILFDTSLGTYDLGLASLVADCLGKDPKEYVPILDELNQLSNFKRKFKIDDKLRRYSKAIEYLIRDQSTQNNEVLKYMERHRLFTDVISFIENLLVLKPCDDGDDEGEEKNKSRIDLTTLLQESKLSYGGYLAEHTKFREAMILYQEGNQLDKAIDCAIKCGDWEGAIGIFYSRSNPETEGLKDLCERILDALEDRKNYSGAARLCEIYLRDFSRAVGYWIRARKWSRARTLSHLILPLDKPGREEDAIQSKLVEAAIDRKEQLETLTGEISQHFRRLQIVKAVKAQRELEGGGGEAFDNFSDTDSMSSYSTRSGSSLSSGRSHRTAKNKRKHEKKLYSMKEGSRHEDLGITAHLWTIFDKIQEDHKPDTSNLITALWEFHENQAAKDLGAALDQLLIESGNAINGIWTSILLDELLEMKYRVPPPNWTTTWDRLSLHDPSSKAMKQ